MTARYEKILLGNPAAVDGSQDSAEDDDDGGRAHLDFSEFEEKDSGKLTSWTAILFIVGNVVGAGVISMPYCMKLAGWAAIPMLFICSLSFVYAGVLLAKSCAKVLEADNKGGSMRDIYPSVAEVAGGKIGRNIITVLMTITLVSSCLIFLLVAGELLQKILPIFGPHVSPTNVLRIWFVVCGCALLPFTFLGSPKDFWFIALIAMATSGLATVCIIIDLSIARHESKGPVEHSSLSLKSFFAAIGIVSFGFSGSSIFPTIQNDLKDPRHFYKAVCVGYLLVTFVYVFVPILSYYVLGSHIKEDLLASLSELPVYHTSSFFKTLIIIAQVAICIHVLCAFVMNVNPVYQQLESHLDIPEEFCWQRCAVRSAGMVILIMVAVAVPKFGPVLSLSGGTVGVLIGLVAPIVIFAFLQETISRWLVAIFITIFLVCIVLVIGSAVVETGNIIHVVEGNYKS